MPGSNHPLHREVLIRPGMPWGHSVALPSNGWLRELLVGRDARTLPDMLASIFNLCGHAHRWCSTLALSAAGVAPSPDPATLSAALRRETVSEHVRRIAIDWARILPLPDPSPAAALMAALPSSPVLRTRGAMSSSDWEAQCVWLENHLLGESAPTWWRQWNLDSHAWLGEWSRRTSGFLPQWLAQSGALGETWHLPLADAAGGGLASHTGCWSRVADGPQRHWSDWTLLGARVADLVALCLDDGSASTGPRRLRWDRHVLPGQEHGTHGEAYVEMARGRLVHRVTLLPGSTIPIVRHYEVLAPTDVNFSPRGALAQAVSLCETRPTTPNSLQRVHRLMAAFDPCVPFRLEPAGYGTTGKAPDA